MLNSEKNNILCMAQAPTVLRKENKIMKTVIITEKPSVAREYAQILHVSGNNDGYIEDENYIITWCIGHLVSMSYPEKYDECLKKWDLDTLPFLPQHYKYEVNTNVRKQFQTVKNQLTRSDVSVILWAGDSGREGQVIEENIRMYVNIPQNIIQKRIWIDSTTEEEVLRGIRQARPMSDYDKLGQSGVMRAIEDYAIGINFSRALSVKYSTLLNRAANLKNYKPIAVGRVMSCVLGMIVARERQLRNFKETKFYRPVLIAGDGIQILAEWNADQERPGLFKTIGFLDQKKAEELVSSLNEKKAIIEQINSKKGRKYAPLLFNLAELQGECTKKFKLSPDQTLSIVQSLYEKKLTTYPRTDARVLSTAISKEIEKNISGIGQIPQHQPFVTQILEWGSHKTISSTKYVDDGKIADHYAIIPTGDIRNYSNLDDTENKVYNLICKRFLSIFYPAAEYGEVSLIITIDGNHFISNFKTLVQPGYLQIYNVEEDNGEVEYARKLSLLQKGSEIKVNDIIIKKVKTTPPSRYTSGSMILAMENAGQLIEEEELREQIKGCGIGTSATRADIIKKLAQDEHISINNRTQILKPTKLGEMIYEVLNDTIPAILNPKMTASWEKGLEQIASGITTLEVYRSKFEDYIRKTVNSIKANDRTQALTEKIAPYGESTEYKDLSIVCPKCKHNTLRLTKKGYGCSGYKKGDKNACNFFVGKICGVLINEKQMEQLVENGITDKIKGFTSKNGTKFSAQLALKSDYSVNFYNEVHYLGTSEIECPKCHKQMDRYDKILQCDCGCQIKCFIAGKTISDPEMRTLLKTGRLNNVNGLISQKNKPFIADIIMGENFKVSLEFDQNHKDTEFTCPDCGKKLTINGWYYTCGCGFKMPHTCAKKKLDANTVVKLLKGEVTDEVTGMIGKKGAFSAKLQRNGSKIEFVKS